MYVWRGEGLNNASRLLYPAEGISSCLLLRNMAGVLALGFGVVLLTSSPEGLAACMHLVNLRRG